MFTRISKLSNGITQRNYPTSKRINRYSFALPFTCTESDQLTAATSILECVPSRNYGLNYTPEILKLHDQVHELERHSKAGCILSRHEIKQSLPVIHQCPRRGYANPHQFDAMTSHHSLSSTDHVLELEGNR